jgi:arginase
MVDRVYARVEAPLRGGRFPLIYGGDCPVLIRAVPAPRDARRRVGLLFIDGHKDATPMAG